MNTGIITSTIIGGIILLSLLFVEIRIDKSMNQTTLDIMAKEEVNDVSQYITFDFSKIGYKAKVFPILFAKKHKFIFLGDVNNDGVCDTVMWKYGPANAGNSSYAPGKQPVYHSVDGVSTNFDRDVTSMEIVYILQDGTETNNPTPKEVDLIRKLKVSITCKIPNINGDGTQIASWQRIFVPPNLQLFN